MRAYFTEQMELLHVEMIRMGALCEDAISNASRVLTGEMNLASEVEKAERDIDEKEREIERLCMRLLLKQQPVATDLREISSALRMISDMERIGDQTLDIVENCRFLKDLKSGSGLDSRIHITEMAQAAANMVTMSVDSFVKRDLELARKVMKYDDVVDGLFNTVKNELIGLIAQGEKDPELGEACIDMLMISKYFERIGDHAVNIAEWVEYSITGKHKGA